MHVTMLFYSLQIIIDPMMVTGQLKAFNELSSEDCVGSFSGGLRMNICPEFFQQTKRGEKNGKRKNGRN
jgi:hypothetical protein